MKYVLLVVITLLAFLISCNKNPASSTPDITVSGTVDPPDAHVLFIMGKDTTEVSVDDQGYFSLEVPSGRGAFVMSAEGYRTYSTSPTYTLSGTYDLGLIKLSDVPYPISNIYRNTGYSQDSYLFYISFSLEMEPSSKSAVSIDPEIKGTLAWSNNNTTLYFYPYPSFVDTAAFTVTVNRKAVSVERDTLDFEYRKTFVPNETRIIRSYPSTNTADFSTSREAYLEFSVAMSDSNLDSAIQVEPTMPLAFRVANKQIYILPASGYWPPSKTVTLSLVDTLYTATSAPFAVDTLAWSFTTSSGSGSTVPYPLSSIYKNSSYSQNQYLFYLNFSVEMKPESKKAVSVQPGIDGSLVWENNNTRLSFYPTPAFMDTAELKVMINTSAISVNNDTLEFNYEKVFAKKEASITRCYPNNNTIDHSTTREAYLEFSVGMSDSNIGSAIKASPNVSLKTRIDGNYIYILPSSGAWPAGTALTLSLEDTLYSLNGTPVFVKNYSWKFTTATGGGNQTGSIPYPVSSIYKSSGYSSNSYLFYINFAVEMDPSSKKAVSTDPSISGSYVWTNNNSTLYFYPSPSFMDTAALTITIDTTAFSVQGDTVDFVYRKTFIPNEARITRCYPDNNATGISTSYEAYVQTSVIMADSNLSNAFQVSPDMPLRVRAAGNYVYLQPVSGSWPSNQTVTITLADTLYSVTGAPLFVKGYSWSFTTSSGSGSNTSVVQITPDSGSTDFSLNGYLYVRTNNTAIYTIAQVKDGFKVLDDSGRAVSGRYNMQSSYFYFYPEGLKLGTWYKSIVVNSGSTSDTLVVSTFRTIPFSPTSISPQNYGILAQPTDPFEFTLNSPVDKLTVVSSLDVSPAGSYTYSVSSNRMTVTISPVAGAWKAGEEYAMSVNRNTLMDINGSAVEYMDSVYHFSAPQVRVIDHSPLNNVSDVDTSASITLTFNTIMDTSVTTPAFSVKDTSGTAFAGGTVTWNSALTQLTFSKPDSLPFTSGMRYTAAVDTTAADGYGVKLQSPFSISFTIK